MSGQSTTATATPATTGFSASSEINRVLPSWLIFNGDYRTRFEGYSGGSFKPDTTDAYLLSRITLGLTIKPTSWLKSFIEAYDAREMFRDPVAPPYENTWDVRQAYVEIGETGKRLFSVRAGRQELNFGEKRLIGSPPFSNVERTFDAILGTLHYKHLRLDAFAASVVNVVDGANDHHLQGNNLHGLYATIDSAGPRATIEPYVLWRLQPRVKNEEGVVANMDEKIPGIRITGKLPHAFDYGAEMVVETGSLGADRIRAWGGHWVVGHTVSSLWATPRIYAEYNFATGDAKSTDGRRGTFDQLYAAGHDKYGLADQVGWRNVKDLRSGLELKPRKNLSTVFEYNDWYLASATDSLYSATGAALFRSATGTAGTHIGQELDFIGSWNVTKTLVAGAGFAHIIPGQFLKTVTPGVAYNYPYIMFGYKF